MIQQANAIIRLRLQLLINRSKSNYGMAELAGSIIVLSILSLIAMGVGVLTWFLLRWAILSGEWETVNTVLMIVTSTIFAVVLIFPIFLFTRGRQGIDPRRLLTFPVSKVNLFLLNFLSEFGEDHILFILPSMVALVIASLLFLHHALAAAGLLVLFLLCIILSGIALNLLLQRIMQTRRIREASLILLSLLFFAICFLPQILQNTGSQWLHNTFIQMLWNVLRRVSAYLPPVMASRAVSALQSGDRSVLIFNAAGLGIIMIVLAGMGFLLFNTVVLDRPSSPVKRRGKGKEIARGGGLIQSIVSWLPPAPGAEAERSLRYLFRSSTGKLQLLLVPLIVLVGSFLFKEHRGGSYVGFSLETLALFGLTLYIAILNTNYFNNLFGWDQGGVKTLFTLPVSGRAILFGKHIAAWLYNLLLFSLMLITYSFLVVFPSPVNLFSALLLFCCITLFTTITGMILSVLFPKKFDIASWKGSTPSSVGVILNMLLLVVTLLLILLFLLPYFFTKNANLIPLSFLFWSFLLVIAYTFVLRRCEGWFYARSERIIQTLSAKE